MQRKKRAGIKKGYKPRPLHNVNLYGLSRDFTFSEQLTPSYSKDSDHLIGYRFQRPSDDTFINYFEPIKDDAESDILDDVKSAKNIVSLETALQKYNELLDSNKIAVQNITIFPLLQVRNGRKHFNTLLIHGDSENNVHIYLIEPRHNYIYFGLPALWKDIKSWWNKKREKTSPSHQSWFSRLKGYVIYPLKQSGKIIAEYFRDKGYQPQVHIINIGSQALADDVTCGYHQANVTEILTQLPTAVLQDSKRVSTALDMLRTERNAYLARRMEDKGKRRIVTGHVPFAPEEKPLQEEEKEKNDTPIEVEEDDFNIIESSSSPEEVKQIIRQSSAFLRLDPESMQNLNRQASENKNIEQAKALDNVSTQLEEYKHEKVQGLHHFSLFKKSHTRQNTVDAIKELRQLILIPAAENSLDEQAKMYLTARLLYAFYITIHSTTSTLRYQLEQALAPLLDCEKEYAYLAPTHKESKLNRNDIEQLFQHRLMLRKTTTGLDPHAELYLEQISGLAKKINKIDASHAYKNKKNQSALNAQKAEFFTEIEDKLSSIIDYSMDGQQNFFR